MRNSLTDLTTELVLALDQGWPTSRIIKDIRDALPTAAAELAAINIGPTDDGTEIGEQPTTPALTSPVTADIDQLDDELEPRSTVPTHDFAVV